MFGNDKYYEEKDKEKDEGNSEWVVIESHFEEITSELAMYGTNPILSKFMKSSLQSRRIFS